MYNLYFSTDDAMMAKEEEVPLLPTVPRKDTMKDLKLRIIHGPLHATSRPRVCCLCCRDTVGELSVEERVITLVCGFTRECFENELPPVIIDECVKFVGSSKDFNEMLLKSIPENRQKPRMEFLRECQDCWQDFCTMFIKCEVCCGCCECWEDRVDPCCEACCECWNVWECLTNYRCFFGYCGDVMIAILVLMSIAMTFGKDVAALLVNNHRECDIMNGSDYVSFNVNEWVLIGSISDISWWIVAICFILCLYIHEKRGGDVGEALPVIFMIGMGCVWCFFVAWIVIGVLLYTEMIGEVGMDHQCTDIVISWVVLQSIPAFLVLCLLGMIVADEGQRIMDNVCGNCGCLGVIGVCYNSTEGLCGRHVNCFGEGCGVFILRGFVVIIFFSFVFGKDVAALVINSIDNCDTIDGGSKYVKLFDVTEWIYIASIGHLSAYIVFFCWIGVGILGNFDEMRYIVPGALFSLSAFLFNISWMVIGFLLYSEMSLDTHAAAQCGDVVLSWSVLQAIETLLLLLFICYTSNN